MAIPGISQTSYIYTPPSNTVTSAQSRTGSGLQQQPADIHNHVVARTKGAVIEEETSGAASAKKIGALIDVTA
jgi:hypothetical protein